MTDAQPAKSMSPEFEEWMSRFMAPFPEDISGARHVRAMKEALNVLNLTEEQQFAAATAYFISLSFQAPEGSGASSPLPGAPHA